MGMGSAPCHAWTISLDGLKAICPKEVELCEAALEALDDDWNSFALAMEQEEQLDDATDDAWEKLQAAFKEATRVGNSCLELGIGYYSADDGDRYDDLEPGYYFTVDNMTQLTPAGEKFKAYMEEKSWTVFG